MLEVEDIECRLRYRDWLTEGTYVSETLADEIFSGRGGGPHLPLPLSAQTWSAIVCKVQIVGSCYPHLPECDELHSSTFTIEEGKMSR